MQIPAQAGTRVTLQIVERSIKVLTGELAPREARHGDWPSVSQKVLLEALVEAVLGGRVRAEVVANAMTCMAQARLLSAASVQRLGAEEWADAVRRLFSTRCPAYPFPGSRTEYLRRTLERFGGDLRCLVVMIRAAKDAREARRRIVEGVCGLGPKQASFFLRQIGYPEPVAILDVHVLAYMRLAGLCEEGKTPQSIHRYEDLERRLLSYAYGRGFSTPMLDSAIWITMRTAREVA